MLDQNTDRMWFVIGALIVGAGIILLANKTMPEIFASVADSFENASERGILQIDGNVFHIKRLENLGIYGYIPEERTIWNTGMHLTNSGNSQGYGWEVQPGEKYRITRENRNTTRFAYGFTKERPKVDTPIYYVDSNYQDALEMEFVVPEGMSYAFLYLTNSATHKEDKSDFKGIKIIQEG